MDSSDTGSDSNQAEKESTGTESVPDHSGEQRGHLSLRRRDALVSLLGVGGIGLLGSQPAGAQQGPPPRRWNKDVDAQGNRLTNLGGLTMQANQTEIVDFEGMGLAIDSNNVLNVTITDTDTRTNVSDDGTQVVANAEDINFASNLSVTDDGDGSVTVDADSTWEDTDNDDLLEASGFDGIDVDFVETPKFGTTTDTELEGVVNDERFLHVDPTTANNAPTIVAGYSGNTAGLSVGATVAGGGQNNKPNTVDSDYGTVGGGRGNKASGVDSTVAGGTENGASGESATVGGGVDNTASNIGSTVGGGEDNLAVGQCATVGGGNDNTASGLRSTVGGGYVNTAGGTQGTIAGGLRNTTAGDYATVPGGAGGAAQSDASFVWNDNSRYHIIPNSSISGLSSDIPVNGEPVTGAATFSVSAQGGVRFITGSNSVTYISGGSTGWSTPSTRAAKTNIDPVDPGEILDGVEEMEVATWEYTDEDGDGKGVRHIGPMAAEFHEAVDIGDSDDHINSINADGVAFAAIQGLAQRQETEMTDLREEIAEKNDRIADLETKNETLRDEIAALEADRELLQERLTAVEERLASLEADQTTQAAADH